MNQQINYIKCSLFHILSDIMRWLEETRLHKDDLYLPSLSFQYDGNRLDKNISTHTGMYNVLYYDM